MRLPLLLPSREGSDPEPDIDQTLLPSGIRPAAAPNPPPRTAPPRPRPFGQLSWEDFENATPVERVSPLLVARARQEEYDPDDPPTCETPIDLAMMLRSASASDLGARRAFGEEPLFAPPRRVEESPTLPSLPTPPSMRPAPPPLAFVPPVVPAAGSTMPSAVLAQIAIEPPPPSDALHLARGLAIGIASAVTIFAAVAAWRIAELLLARM